MIYLHCFSFSDWHLLKKVEKRAGKKISRRVLNWVLIWKQSKRTNHCREKQDGTTNVILAVTPNVNWALKKNVNAVLLFLDSFVHLEQAIVPNPTTCPMHDGPATIVWNVNIRWICPVPNHHDGIPMH